MNDSFLVDGPDGAQNTLILAHGAGAPMDSDFMNVIAAGLGQAGIRVVRFEFPYMRKRRAEGSKKPPDRAPVLLESWREVIRHWGDGSGLFIGGKSMGGRMASMLADEVKARGVVCLGYPFHPPGKPEKLRTEHLIELRTPCLVVQGERDPFGTKQEVPGYGLSDAIELCWCPDGDHSLKPRKKSGFDEAGNLALAVCEIAAFIHRV